MEGHLSVDPSHFVYMLINAVKELDVRVAGRGLHSSTFWLNVSAFCGIGGASRGCFEGIEEVSGVTRGCVGCVLCQKWLRLSSKVAECKPLVVGLEAEVRALRAGAGAAGAGAGAAAAE